MKYSTLVLSALVAFTGAQAWAQTNNISSIAITTGVVDVKARIGPNSIPIVDNNNVPVTNNIAGLAYVAGDLSLQSGPTSIALYTLTGATLLGGVGNPADTFVGYGTTTLLPTPRTTYDGVANLPAKFGTGSYSALTFSEDNLALPSSRQFYTIHHRGATDYFATVVPRSGAGSTVADLKPMSWPGGVSADPPNDPGLTGYFALAYGDGAALLPMGVAGGIGATKYPAKSMYYLRTDAGHTKFGVMIPALSGASQDTLDLTTAVGSFGVGGYTALAFVGPPPIEDAINLGYGVQQFYYLRQDIPVSAGGTGNTILGTLNPDIRNNTVRTISDIANLGGVYSALTFAFDTTGTAGVWGGTQLYVTGSRAVGAQSISFAAISDHAVGIPNNFVVHPTASSGGVIALTVVSVVPGATGTATIAAGPGLGDFTITPTAPGIVTLQATQGTAGIFPYNMMRQSFRVLGTPAITSAATAAGTVGLAFTYNVTANGDPIISYSATGLAGTGLSLNPGTGAITGAPIALGIINATIAATNASGLGVSSTLDITVVAAGSVPSIFSATTAAATAGTFFTYNTLATGFPTSYTAGPLPAGLAVNLSNGAITGTPTAFGTTVVTLTATNGAGTSSPATVTITVAPAVGSGGPIYITSPSNAAGTVGTPFATYRITATGLPTSYSASNLPAGLTIDTLTGAINGTPTTAGTSVSTMIATNAANDNGTGFATLTITIAPISTAPIITSPTTAPGTVGTTFITCAIVATGLPTSYGATGLPAGLTVNSLTGRITGTPTTAGIAVATLSATNSFGTGTATLTITVAPVAVAPIITSPISAVGTVGKIFVTYLITATGLPTSYTATGLPTGLTLSSLTGAINGTPTIAGISVATLNATNSTGTGTATLTITVAPASLAPIITSPTTAPGTAGTAFVSYAIVATGLPTSYGATGLPTGLTVNTLSGTINGTPATAGTSVVTLSATNTTGTGTATLIITVAPSAVAPIITSPTSAPGTVGKPFVTYLIAATGLPTSYTAFNLPPGLALNPLTGAINGTPTAAGTTFVTLTATNASGSSTATLMIVIAPDAAAPIITSSTNATGVAGTPFITYLITATGLPTSYAATGLPAGLSVNSITGAINGTPTVAGTSFVTITATNASGSSTISLMIVVLPVASSRIVNFAARAVSGPGSQSLIMGFVVSGDNKNLLVRGIGPSLAAFGVSNPIADPLLTLYDANGPIATNDDWGISSSGQNQATLVAATSARVGAFALPSGSKDSALLFTVNNGAHTSGLLRPNSTTGVALTEIYDTDTILGARLINVSARMNVTTGEGTLIAGLVIAGNAPKTVLVRGVGPTLSAFAVTGVMADPLITVYSGNTQIASNDNWETGTSTAAQIISASAQVGAFALPAGSKDAALLITLQPGAYTVRVTGVGDTTGVALVEVYDTQ